MCQNVEKIEGNIYDYQGSHPQKNGPFTVRLAGGGGGGGVNPLVSKCENVKPYFGLIMDF